MNEPTAQLSQAIELGLHYLHQHQYPNGEFCCYYAPDAHMQEWCVPDSTVFPTAIIATSLLPLAGQPQVEEILTRATGFLQYQMMPGGAWNYFTSWHPLHKHLPPDADDTVYVSTFFRARQVPYPQADTEALLLAQRNTHGLFYTWFTLRLRRTLRRSYWRTVLREMKNPLATFFFWRQHDCARNDIDSVVNANTLHYLGLTTATRPALAYLLQIVADNREAVSDNWYHNPFTLYYSLARSYFAGISELAPARQLVIDRILATARPGGQLGESVLDSALAVCILLYWGCPPATVASTVQYLLAQQRPTGDWPRWILSYSGRQAKVGWGSEELTTGFCLEALARYQQAMAAPTTTE
jgi:hypothetical protein